MVTLFQPQHVQPNMMQPIASEQISYGIYYCLHG